MQCTNIDVCETSRNYAHILEKVMIKCSWKKFLKLQWSPLFRDLQITVQCHMDIPWLSKGAVQENHSVHLPKFGMLKKTAVHRVGASKSKQKAIVAGIILWSSIPKRKGYKKVNEQVKKYLYNWILQNPQVVQSPIAKDCLKVFIYGHSEPQLVLNILLQVCFRELHHIIVRPLEEGGLK